MILFLSSWARALEGPFFLWGKILDFEGPGPETGSPDTQRDSDNWREIQPGENIPLTKKGKIEPWPKQRTGGGWGISEGWNLSKGKASTFITEPKGWILFVFFYFAEPALILYMYVYVYMPDLLFFHVEVLGTQTGNRDKVERKKKCWTSANFLVSCFWIEA